MAAYWHRDFERGNARRQRRDDDSGIPQNQLRMFAASRNDCRKCIWRATSINRPLPNFEPPDRIAKLTLQMESADRRKDGNADLARHVFASSQSSKAKWLTADFAANRRLLDYVCLSFVLKGFSLCFFQKKALQQL